MNRKDIFQRWITLSGDDSGDEVIQEHPGWLDTHGFKRMVLSAQVLALTNATLTVETADTRAGPWTTAVTVAATGVTYIQAEAGAAAKLERCVRWKLVSTNTTWQACFWFAYELKT